MSQSRRTILHAEAQGISEALGHALDEITNKFGTDAVRPAVNLDED